MYQHIVKFLQNSQKNVSDGHENSKNENPFVRLQTPV